MPNMGLVLHCKLKYRVWPHAHMGRLRLKIFFTPKLLPKRPHGTKFQQNPRNGGSQNCHEIENLSVKKIVNWQSVFLVIRFLQIKEITIQKKRNFDTFPFQNQIFFIFDVSYVVCLIQKYILVDGSFELPCYCLRVLFLGILEKVVAYFENLQRYNDIFYGSSNCAF